MFRFIKPFKNKRCGAIALPRMIVEYLSQRDIPNSGFIPIFSPCIEDSAIYEAGRELSYLTIDAKMKRDCGVILFIDNHYDARTASILAEMAREHHYGFCVANTHDDTLPSGSRIILYIPTKGWSKEGDTEFNKNFLIRCLTTIMDKKDSFAFIYKASMPFNYYASLKRAHVAVLFEDDDMSQSNAPASSICINKDGKTCSINGGVKALPYISGRYLV